MMFFIRVCLFFLCVVFSYAVTDYREVLDGAVVINLARHIHRFELTKTLMEQSGFTNVQRFDAIDGFFTDFKFFEALNIHTGSPGQRGCAASHLLAWSEFLNFSDKRWLFVAEDDMLPHSAFAQIFPHYWEKTPEDFDLIMVGNQMTVSEQDPLVISEPSFCPHAYIVSKSGARKLLAAYKTLQKGDKDKHVIDIFLISLMCNRLPGCEPLRFYCYNGLKYKDIINRERDWVWGGRDTGICFQNRMLGSSIHQIQIVPENISGEAPPERKKS